MATHYVSLIDAAIQASSRVVVFSRSGTILTAERHQGVVRAHAIAKSLIVGGSFVDASVGALTGDAQASIVAGHSSLPNSAQRFTTPKAPSDVFRNLELMAELRLRFDRSAKVALAVADRLNRVLQDRSPEREFAERLATGVMTMGTSELFFREPFYYCQRLLPDLRKCADAARATRASLDLVMGKCRKAARESSIDNAREHMLEVGEPAEMAVRSCSEHNDLVRRAAPLVPVAMREAVDAATHANQLRQAALLSWPDTEAASVFAG